MMSHAPLILVGTVSGNSFDCAKKLVELLAEASIETRLMDMSDFPPENLSREKCILIVTSTWGDGEPPDNALALWEYIVHARQKLELSDLAYSVLALGSSDFEHFCRCGRDFDMAMSRHGALKICPRVECNNSWEDSVMEFADAVLPYLISAMFRSFNQTHTCEGV